MGQSVAIDQLGENVYLGRGERIHTESSQKYTSPPPANDCTRGEEEDATRIDRNEELDQARRDQRSTFISRPMRRPRATRARRMEP